MTSYKATRNLLMNIPAIEKTVFLIDRKDLDMQTKMAFQSFLTQDKAVIVDVLKDKCPLPLLLKRISLSKSSYYYQKAAFRKKVTELFHENEERYGYRRIYGLLKREGITLSEKAVRRLMQEEGLEVRTKRRRKSHPFGQGMPLPLAGPD